MRSFLVLVALLGGVLHVQASHFRYGQITYTQPDPINNPGKVDISVKVGWRANALDNINLALGDGQVKTLYRNLAANSGAISDGNGESYSILTYATYSHTYADPSNVYTIRTSTCCRVGSLANDPGGQFTLETTVNLSQVANTPVAGIPAIIQLGAGQSNSLDISSFINTNGESIVCSYATGDAGYSPVPYAGGSSLGVGGCVLDWDLTNYNPSGFPKYSASLVIEVGQGFRMSLDFIIEVGPVSTIPLTCAALGAVSFTPKPGDHIHQVEFEIGGPGTVGDVVLQTIDFPGGNAVINSQDASTPLPAIWDFHWTVPAVNAPTLTQITLIWQIGQSQCFQTITVAVDCNDIDSDGACDPSPIVEGDPHFMTWNGTWYDYMGMCDLVLVDAPNFDDSAALRVEIRTTGRWEYSYVESAAVQIGDDILEVSSFGTYFLNGVEGARFPKLMAVKYPVTHKQINKKSDEFTIALGHNEAIVISTFKDLVSVKLDQLHDKRFVGSRGMLGDYDTGKTMARDGTTELFDPTLLAAEWQVRPEEDGLFFQTVRAPQYPEGCKAPKKQTQLRGDNLIAAAAAEKACGRFTGFQKEACVHDVLATGEFDLAATF
jgi:hypothetical protein